MTSSVPNFPSISNTGNGSGFVKPATVDLILDDESVPIELMTNLIFEDIGGQELISIARTDLLNGQDVVYQPITNLSKIALQYNSKNLVPIAGSADQIFKNFQINIDEKLLQDASAIFIDDETGDLVVRLTNLEQDEEVEIQVARNIQAFDGTIYLEQI